MGYHGGMECQSRIVPTTPFEDQRPGTSGLRRKTRRFMQPHYVENFVQSIFDSVREEGTPDFCGETLVVGGDGRYHNREAIQSILKIAAANGFGRILVGRGGLLSTPAMSAVIRRRGALGGILLTASHNPGGAEADFGIKYNIRNGGPAPEGVTEGIYAHTRAIERFLTLEAPGVDLDRERTLRLGGAEVAVIDPISDYVSVLGGLFDFDALRGLFRNGFRLVFDAMHGVTGPYGRAILEGMLEAPEGTVIRGTPLEDFGGGHPDPDRRHAGDLFRRMSLPDSPDMGAACDGDGDRNMILGRGVFVSPGDSLAVIAEHAAGCIPGYRSGLRGVARSMPTSTAVDRVARALGVPCHETPTGWKFFGNLMDSGRCTLCGEESFGTGSDHVREKDGIWAVLCWLSILAGGGASVGETLLGHWRRFGRSYFQRHDYAGLDAVEAGRMMADLGGRVPSLAGTRLADAAVRDADDFSYTDPVDGSVSRNQGVRILLDDGSRIVGRLSGTGTEGATLRLYFERVRPEGGLPLDETLAPLVQAARGLLRIEERFGRTSPSVVT